MAFYIAITIITIVLSIFVRRQENNIENSSIVVVRNRVLIISIFTILFLVSALRYEVGFDYCGYIGIFQRIYEYRRVSTEIGFNLIVRFFQWFLGPDTFIPIFAAMAWITIYYMIKSLYQEMKIFWLGFTIFMMSAFYFNSLTTIRYYVAFAMAMYASKFILEKKHLKFIIYILLAATIHMSVLVVIPVYYFASLRWKKSIYLLVSIGVISLLLFEDFYRRIIFFIYPYYENSIYDTNTTSLFNIIKAGAIVVFALVFYKKWWDDRKTRFYFQLNIVAFIVYSCCSFIPVVSRIAYYFVWAQVFLVVDIISKLENKKLRYAIISVVLAAYIIVFILFIKDVASPEIRLAPYKTWIGL